MIPNDAREQLRLDDFEPQVDKIVNRRMVEADVTDLADAKKKIADLEAKLESLEIRIPKKYPDVKYLNYKLRKRILVRFIFTCLDSYRYSYMYFNYDKTYTQCAFIGMFIY